MRAKMQPRDKMLPSEIGRMEIQELTNASYSKIHKISTLGRQGFPPKLRIVNRMSTFDRELVLKWIAENDINTVIAGVAVATKTDDFNSMARAFITRRGVNENA